MELEEVLEQCLGQNFVHMIISNPKKGDFAGKVGVRCYEDKGTLMFQFARYQNNQVFHLNYAKEEAKKLYSFRTRAHLPSDAVLYNGKTVYNIDKQKRENNNKGKKQKK